MNKSLKKTVAALSVASLMVVGIASAQDATAVPETSTDTTADVRGFRLGGRGMILSDLVLEYTGLDAAALHEAIAGGATLTELIEANGMSVEDFVAAALAEYDTQAAERRTAFEENLTAVLSGELPVFDGAGLRDGGRGMGRPGDGRGGRGGFPGAPAAEVTPEGEGA